MNNNNHQEPEAHIAVTFAIEHLEDSPANYILITFVEGEEAGDMSLDMRVKNPQILKSMLQHLLMNTAPNAPAMPTASDGRPLT